MSLTLSQKMRNLRLYLGGARSIIYMLDQDVGEVISIGTRKRNWYLSCIVRAEGGVKWKRYYIHRFIWDCFNGFIPDGFVIDHCNDLKDDSRLCILQLMTQQENCLKSARNRDLSFVLNRSSKKLVKVINLTTKEVHYFPSLHSVNKELGASAGLVKFICYKKYGYKTAQSRFEDYRYTFENID